MELNIISEFNGNVALQTREYGRANLFYVKENPTILNNVKLGFSSLGKDINFCLCQVIGIIFND